MSSTIRIRGVHFDFSQPGRGPGVDGEDNRNSVRDRVDCSHDEREAIRKVHVGRTMQREDSILPRLQAVRQRQLTGTTDLLA